MSKSPVRAPMFACFGRERFLAGDADVPRERPTNVDVYPPNADFPAGVDFNIADSIVRARCRNNFGKAELLTPDSLTGSLLRCIRRRLCSNGVTGFA